MMKDPLNTEYFRAEAALMREFAEEAVDEEVAEAFRWLAARFEAKARRVEVGVVALTGHASPNGQ